VTLSDYGITFWEGDVTITGKIRGATVSGDGYTELNPPGAGP
jgi:predicted secreted hydrolase